MFRFTLIVCVSLICGIAARPHKPWNKLTDEALQDTVIKGEIQVEPPEDMDETSYDIDPSMLIWKSMIASGKDQQYLKAEKDLDELDHPSIQNLDPLPPADIPALPRQEDANMKYQEPEEDMDDVYHNAREEVLGYLAPLVAEYNAAPEAHVKYSEPEKDEDELYHHSDQASPGQVDRVHREPEEDMDDVYHGDLLEIPPHHGDTNAAPDVNLPFQGTHTEPEEDLDHLYHP